MLHYKSPLRAIDDAVRVAVVSRSACLWGILMERRDDSCGAYQSAWRTLTTLYAWYLCQERPDCERFQRDLRTMAVGHTCVCCAHQRFCMCGVCVRKRLSGKDFSDDNCATYESA
jgi:hypothetical protein